MVKQIDEYSLTQYQHKQLLSKLVTLLNNYTIPQELLGLQQQHATIQTIYEKLLREGGDKRRHNRGSREERLPNGCTLRQRLSLPNKQGYHDKILFKKNDTYICAESKNMYSTLHQANEAHYVECGKVWTAEDEKRNPRHKAGRARNAVSAWGNGVNSQAFYALRVGTEDQFNIPIINVNDDEWFNQNVALFSIRTEN